MNDHANVVLGIGLRFFEPVKDDVLTNLEYARETSDVDEDDELNEPPLNVHGAPTLPLVDMED